MKKVMCKIKDEFFCYLSFCRSCRYFKNNSEELVATNMGMAKYVAAWLLIAVLAAVSVLTSRTQLPDGTPVSIDLLYTNWYMWVAALMLLVAISTRGVQSCKLMPMSHRRRMAYFMLRPLIVAAIVCICLIVLFWLVVICIAVMQKLAEAIPSVDVDITEVSAYSLCPAAHLWVFASVLFCFSAVLFAVALPPKKANAARGGIKHLFAELAEYKRHFAVFAGLLFYYVLSFIACNLTPYKPAQGFEFFANPVIALQYLPVWQGWLFAGIMAAVAMAVCTLAIVFTYRECKPKDF